MKHAYTLRGIFTVAILLFASALMQAQIVLQRCDVANLWEGSNTINVNSAEKKEGAASITFRAAVPTGLTRLFRRPMRGWMRADGSPSGSMSPM